MLNYIWAGLIFFSLVFALVTDITDLSQDTYRNDQPVSVSIHFETDYNEDTRIQPATVVIDQAYFADHYGEARRPADNVSVAGSLIQTNDGTQFRMNEDASLPAPLDGIREFTAKRDGLLRATIKDISATSDSLVYTTALLFAPVQFVKLNAISAAALDFAEISVTIALGLIGVMALWLGLMAIAEAAGMIKALVKIVQPVMRPLFPEIPDGHPALGMIVLNMAANVLGLGSAATPMGLKAMEELQKLNPKKDTASNSMVMFLALNTSSVQLMPPTLLVAVMGLQINQLIFSIILATTVATIVAVAVTKLLQKLPSIKKSDPMLLAGTDQSEITEEEQAYNAQFGATNKSNTNTSQTEEN